MKAMSSRGQVPTKLGRRRVRSVQKGILRRLHSMILDRSSKGSLGNSSSSAGPAASAFEVVGRT